MHYAISTNVLGQTHMWNMLKQIRSNFLNFSLFICFWIFFLHTQKQMHKSKFKCKNNKNNAYKEMHDAQMHEKHQCMKGLTKIDRIRSRTNEQKLNHRNPSSSKQNDCLEWVFYEKWDESWKNENRRCT